MLKSPLKAPPSGPHFKIFFCLNVLSAHGETDSNPGRCRAPTTTVIRTPTVVRRWRTQPWTRIRLWVWTRMWTRLWVKNRLRPRTRHERVPSAAATGSSRPRTCPASPAEAVPAAAVHTWSAWKKFHPPLFSKQFAICLAKDEPGDACDIEGSMIYIMDVFADRS